MIKLQCEIILLGKFSAFSIEKKVKNFRWLKKSYDCNNFSNQKGRYCIPYQNLISWRVLSRNLKSKKFSKLLLRPEHIIFCRKFQKLFEKLFFCLIIVWTRSVSFLFQLKVWVMAQRLLLKSILLLFCKNFSLKFCLLLRGAKFRYIVG